MSLTGALVALGEIEKETNLLSGLTGNANESIGGHARRLAAEYSPDGQCHDLIGQALNTILKRDSNASGNHHRSFACSIVVEEMYKSMFQGPGTGNSQGEYTFPPEIVLLSVQIVPGHLI